MLEMVKVNKKEDKEVSTLNDYDFMKKFYYTLWNSAIKGWYHSNDSNIIDNECMGDWMDEGMDNLNKMITDDSTSFPKPDDMKKTFNFGVDLVYKNSEKCNVYKVASDSMTWCSDNVGACMYGEGFMKRLEENSIPLVSKVIELFKMMMNDNNVEKNDDAIDKMGLFTEDIAYMAASLVGFEGKIHSEASELTID